MSIEAWKDVLILVERYGLAVVLLFIIGYGYYLMQKQQNKRYDELFRTILDVKNNVPDVELESVERLVALNTKVRSCLGVILTNMKCQWAQLWQFHNGMYSVGQPRIPFMFLALTHECVEDQHPEMYTEFRQLPLSMFDQFSNELMTGDLIVHEYDKDTAASGFGQIMTSYGGRTVYIRTVRDELNNIIGFVTAVYDKETVVPDAKKTLFMNSSQQMSAILSSVREKTG